MEKKLFLWLLLLIGCNTSNPQKESGISDMNLDFPTADTLQLTYKFSIEPVYDVYEYHFISDSVLWNYQNNRGNCGFCYNLNNGERITTLALRGKAGNEILGQSIQISAIGDCIQFHETDTKRIKSFLKHDILTKPVGERQCRVSHTPDSIGTWSAIELPNGSIFGTIFGSSSNDRFFIANNDTFTPIGEYDLNLCESIAGEKPVLDQVKQVNSHFHLTTFNNRIALTSECGIEFIVIDAEKKQITAERRYSKLPIKLDGRVTIGVSSVVSNKDHIFVIIRDPKVKKLNICVYDWDLNPVKKFVLNNYLSATCIVSADGKKVYSLVKNGEERDLFEGNLNL